MNVSALNGSYNCNCSGRRKNNSSVNFGATPQQIYQKLENAQNICPGKKRMLTNIADFFSGIEAKMKKSKDLPDKFEYNLIKKSPISEKMAKLTPGGTGDNANATLKEFDDTFRKATFKCSPTSTCSCGKGMTLGEFASMWLEKIGCSEPEKITISK